MPEWMRRILNREATPEVPAVRRVALFSGELPSGLSSLTDAYVDEASDLVVETQDIGAELVRIFGDSDYEWWVRVRAADKPELLERLRDSKPPAASAGDNDALLLSLLARKFGGRPTAPSDLRKWLDEQGIAYEFSSYA